MSDKPLPIVQDTTGLTRGYRFRWRLQYLGFTIFGPADQLLRLIEAAFPDTDILLRGNEFTISGPAADEAGRCIAILQDLSGPKIRTGRFVTGFTELKEGTEFCITTDESVPGTDEIVSTTSLYGGTYNLFHYTLPKLGIEVSFVEDPDDLESWRAAVRPNTKAFFAETIGNPRINVLDIRAVADVAHASGVPLITDNTIATPYLIRPLEHGADIVVHSATKFLGGHGTVMGGVIVDGGKFEWSKNVEKFPGLVAHVRPADGVVGVRVPAEERERECAPEGHFVGRNGENVITVNVSRIFARVCTDFVTNVPMSMSFGSWHLASRSSTAELRPSVCSCFRICKSSRCTNRSHFP